MKKLILLILFLVLINLVYAGWCDDTVCYQHDLNVFNVSKHWALLNYTGEEETRFNVTITKVNSTHTSICLIPKEQIKFNDKYFKALKFQAKQTGADDLIDVKEDINITQNGLYVVSACLLANQELIDYFQVGTETIVTAYQDVNIINYHSDWFDVNVTLYKWINEEWQINPEEVYVFNYNDSYKFGANDTANDNISEYKYIVDSNIEIRKGKGYVYHLSKFTKNNEERHQFNFKDICNRNFTTNCIFNLNKTNLEVTFLSDMFIDPVITIENVSSYGAILYNVTEESPPILHETINDSSLILYMPFDVMDNSKTYDYTDNDNDGTIQYGAVWDSFGKYGGSYYFAGTDDDILISDPDNLNLTKGFTFAIWQWQNSAGDVVSWITKGDHA